MMRAEELVIDYAELDPGIRNIVRLLNDAGFKTTDSGDGVSKPAEWYQSGEAMTFPHVVVATTSECMIVDANGLADLLGSTWVVEACYDTLSKRAYLLARTMYAREK